MAVRPVQQRKAQDPDSTVPRLVTVVDRVLAGDIVLPKFQRNFVWTRQQVLDLLDSVSRNYPIGSVLLWLSTEELASERTVAGLAVEEPRHGYPVNYILDGQQRLASICGALHWEPDNDPDSLWNIVYDLEEQEFKHTGTLDGPSPHVIPVRLLADGFGFASRVSRVGSDELQERAKALYNRFSNYQIAVITLRGMPSNEVAKVFERINSTATQLTVVDLMRAATWSPEFDLKDEIDKLLEVLDRKKYGRVDTKTMLRTVSAAAGFGFSRDDMNGLRDLSREELENAVEAAGESAKRAVDFLTTQIGTPRASALPYLNQFAVLVEIFHQVPKPTTAQFDAIEHWFWLTASGEYYKGWNARQMADDREAIGAFARGERAEIEVGAGLPRSVLWRLSQFRATNSPSKLLGLMLAGAHPVDLRHGRRIDTDKALSWQNDKEFHHFFPKAFLKKNGIGFSRANVCANLIMLSSVTNIYVSDQPPSVYLKDLCETQGKEKIRKRLASCLVDDAAFEAALRDDYEGFLQARSDTLHQRLMQLIGPSVGEAGEYVAVADEAESESLVSDDPVDRDSAD
ncbi:hypothetical protein DMH03_09650 [Amycolatopsis sp. WAC 01376]|uniref:DUF262 domain-containing protein n=1 Tax=Amycolatopsis sp. WAC 01376 TaxID=2203195 RepID=UPI000F76EC89|nr:DUF262 domain-containing protein [Amycolatopsis sp. WAC 01376]RSM62370.1 hypothetical protein DMH03_09650 [Amycolatopsis sp. WAC 01376]